MNSLGIRVGLTCTDNHNRVDHKENRTQNKQTQTQHKQTPPLPNGVELTRTDNGLGDGNMPNR